MWLRCHYVSLSFRLSQKRQLIIMIDTRWFVSSYKFWDWWTLPRISILMIIMLRSAHDQSDKLGCWQKKGKRKAVNCQTMTLFRIEQSNYTRICTRKSFLLFVFLIISRFLFLSDSLLLVCSIAVVAYSLWLLFSHFRSFIGNEITMSFLFMSFAEMFTLSKWACV